MGDQERKQHTQKTFEELIASSEQWGQDLNKLNNIADGKMLVESQRFKG